MAKARTPDQILAALKKWHVRYVEYPGWKTRTRPGDLTDVVGIVEHHTGGGSASASYLKFLFQEGRPAEGIPGPLCNVATAADGTVHLGAVGRANHAGSGSALTLTHVDAEDYDGYVSELKPGSDGTNGNPRFYGNEWIYSGTKAPDPRQYRGAVLWTAAMCDAHGWTAKSAIAHREWTRRKNDPFGVRMPQFRKDVAAVLKAGPAATANYVAKGVLAASTTEEDNPMAGLTAADRAVLTQAFKDALAAERPTEDARQTFDNKHDSQEGAWMAAANAVAQVRAKELMDQGMPVPEVITTVKDEVWGPLSPLWNS